MTIDVTNAMKELKLPERLRENLGLLIEIRDNAIHFMNVSKLFEKKFLEFGTSSLKSYVNMVNNWFEYDLSQYNFYLMPISFFHNHEMQSFSINKEDSEEKFQKKYPWSWTKDLKPKIQSRYKSFKMNNDFCDLKRELEKDKKLSAVRHLDWNNPKSPKMKFYSTEILKDFACLI